MKTLLPSFALCAALVSGQASSSAPESAPPKSFPGEQIAQTISLVTGVAISPLLGVGAVGAWKYFRTPSENKAQLPWFARPLFWIPALLLVAACFAKDALGTAAPSALKKPFDVAEAIENKISGLVAAGAFIPLIAMIFPAVSGEATAPAAHGFAAINLAPVIHVLLAPFAMIAFVIVWLVSHALNILILLSPITILDAALKAFRVFILSTVTFTSFANPYVGAAWALLIILFAAFVAGWSFRLTVYGSVYVWDFVTRRRRRFVPGRNENWMFLAEKVEETPVRAYGRLSQDQHGNFVFRYRPWLLLAEKSITLPRGQYAVGRGLLLSEIVRVESENTFTVMSLPPRFRGHEAELAGIYRLGEVHDLGLIRGLKAAWHWLKDLCGFGQTAATPA